MHYICESPSKDRTTRVCVGETERVRFTINLTLMLQYTVQKIISLFCRILNRMQIQAQSTLAVLFITLSPQFAL